MKYLFCSWKCGKGTTFTHIPTYIMLLLKQIRTNNPIKRNVSNYYNKKTSQKYGFLKDFKLKNSLLRNIT